MLVDYWLPRLLSYLFYKKYMVLGQNLLNLEFHSLEFWIYPEKTFLHF